MAVSKVAYDGHTLIDLTQDTAVESDVADGKYFHKSNGERVQGTSGKVIVQGSDSSAFLIRPTAGETLAPLDCDRKSVLKKLGNTECVNQLARARESRTVYGLTFTNNDDGTATLSGTASGSGSIGVAHSISAIESHKYLVRGDGKNPRIVTNVSAIQLTFEVASGQTYNEKFTPIVIDLSLWFGSNDRIPSDLLSHPENWGRYYAGSLDYAAGYLGNADGTILTSIHRNIWDEEWEVGGYYTSNGAPSPEADRIRTKNYIEVIPNTSYYAYDPTNGNNLNVLFYDANKAFISATGWHMGIFNTPANCRFIHFYTSGAYGNTYNHNITISLYYSGESGYSEYYPYTVLAEVDTGSEVLRSAGAVADEKTPDGTITRRVGYVDLGTINWSYDSGNDYMNSPAGTPPGAKAQLSGMPNAHLGAEYTLVASNELGNSTGKCYTLWNGRVFVKGSGYTSAAAFKTAMSGVYLYYELATPTTEQGTAFTGLQKVDGHGTEMVTGGTTGIPVPFAAQYLKTINAAPTDTIVITENGSHDVAMYAGAIVDVSGGGTPSLQSKTVNLDSNAPSTVYPGTGYNGLSSVAFNTSGINANKIKDGESICGVQGSYKGAAFNHSVGINIEVADGTYQLSLALNYRTTDSTDVKWATMTPEEHEEDGYYTYTANVNLCTGSAMDGFFLTESSGYNLDSGYMAGKTYIEVYHSGNTRTWYFFVPSDASTYNIVFTP